MMIRGRHRMLPYALDRAIMLPVESQFTERDNTSSESDGAGPAQASPASCSPCAQAGYPTSSTVDGLDSLSFSGSL